MAYMAKHYWLVCNFQMIFIKCMSHFYNGIATEFFFSFCDAASIKLDVGIKTKTQLWSICILFIETNSQRLLHYWSEFFCHTNLQIIHPSINYPPLICAKLELSYAAKNKTITYILLFPSYHAHMRSKESECNMKWPHL